VKCVKRESRVGRLTQTKLVQVKWHVDKMAVGELKWNLLDAYHLLTK
jgi:hypothetical protein